MGENPSPPMSSMYLYVKERDFVNNLVKELGEETVLKEYDGFKYCARFIDDRISNLEEDKLPKPFDYDGLSLRCTSEGANVTFLGIVYSADAESGKVIFNVQDKQKAFPHKLVRFPSSESCIPDHIRTGTVITMLVRAWRYCTLTKSFFDEAEALFARFSERGYAKALFFKSINKFCQRNIAPVFRHEIAKKLQGCCDTSKAARRETAEALLPPAVVRRDPAVPRSRSAEGLRGRFDHATGRFTFGPRGHASQPSQHEHSAPATPIPSAPQPSTPVCLDMLRDAGDLYDAALPFPSIPTEFRDRDRDERSVLVGIIRQLAAHVQPAAPATSPSPAPVPQNTESELTILCRNIMLIAQEAFRRSDHSGNKRIQLLAELKDMLGCFGGLIRESRQQSVCMLQNLEEMSLALRNERSNAVTNLLSAFAAIRDDCLSALQPFTEFCRLEMCRMVQAVNSQPKVEEISQMVAEAIGNQVRGLFLTMSHQHTSGMQAIAHAIEAAQQRAESQIALVSDSCRRMGEAFGGVCSNFIEQQRALGSAFRIDVDAITATVGSAMTSQMTHAFSMLADHQSRIMLHVQHEREERNVVALTAKVSAEVRELVQTELRLVGGGRATPDWTSGFPALLSRFMEMFDRQMEWQLRRVAATGDFFQQFHQGVALQQIAASSQRRRLLLRAPVPPGPTPTVESQQVLSPAGSPSEGQGWEEGSRYLVRYMSVTSASMLEIEAVYEGGNFRTESGGVIGRGSVRHAAVISDKRLRSEGSVSVVNVDDDT